MTHEWRNQAACRGTDTNVFFPPSDRPSESARIAYAKRICAACPVRAECLAWALETRDRWSILGGTSPGDRDRIRWRDRRVKAKAAKRGGNHG